MKITYGKCDEKYPKCHMYFANKSSTQKEILTSFSMFSPAMFSIFNIEH